MKKAVIITVFVLAGLGCQMMSDLTSSEEADTSGINGIVLDSRTEAPVEGVVVLLDGKQVVTDVEGGFYFNNVKTGPQKLTLFRSDIVRKTESVNVGLEEQTVILHAERKNTPPYIVSFYSTVDSTLRSFNDSVDLYFQLEDTTALPGSFLDYKIITGFADTFTSLARIGEQIHFRQNFTAPSGIAVDTTALLGTAIAIKKLLLVESSEGNDTQSISFNVISNYAPRILMVRDSFEDPSLKGFWAKDYNVRPGDVDITFRDQDRNIKRLWIEWKDSSGSISHTEHEPAWRVTDSDILSHVYKQAGYYDICIKIIDYYGAADSLAKLIYVTPVNRMKIAQEFKDTDIIIGNNPDSIRIWLRVENASNYIDRIVVSFDTLSIDTFIQTIYTDTSIYDSTWTDSVFYRADLIFPYGPITGNANEGINPEFELAIPTASMPANYVNTISVWVADSLGHSDQIIYSILKQSVQ
jgi:hypothetical protein